ncbi:MAG: hypothetical protein NWE98_01390 [Candidatus Bathyarchaeota archaeon]|nr:hypothetical protein [Candidatus Bathyarchaeota archaeon]
MISSLSENGEEQVLTSLGLTQSQARVYLALIHHGPSKVMFISQVTGIHRAHLYEILRSLQENGFVDRDLDKKVFTATPLREVAPILVKQKQKEIAELENQVNSIASHIHQKTNHTQIQPNVILTSNRTLTLNRAQKFIAKACLQLDSMHTWKRFQQAWIHFEATWVAAMKKGVRVREIVGLPKDIAQAQEFLARESLQNKNFEIKFIPRTGGNFTVIDKNMLLLSTTQEKENLGEAPFIFSNYEGLVGLMDEYFQLAWTMGSDLTTALNKSK